MTSRVDEAQAQSGAREPAPQLVLGYVSLWHSTRASARTARAYSNIRRGGWPLAYLDMPFLFVLFTGVLAVQPNTFVSLGRASAQFDRAGQTGETQAPRSARLLWLVFIVAGAALVAGGPIGLALITGPGPAAVTAVKAWLFVAFGVPLVGYVVPALIQTYRGRGVRDWKAATTSDTGLPTVFVSMLGVWPATGGGRKGSGDGFTLMRALAAQARTDKQIMVGVARSKKLARKYVDRTGAEQSPHNPRHLRWP